MSSSTPVETVAVSNATSTSASSSLTASVLSESPQSFRKQGGTVKRNILGKNEVWEFFQIYNEKNFKTHTKTFVNFYVEQRPLFQVQFLRMCDGSSALIKVGQALYTANKGC